MGNLKLAELLTLPDYDFNRVGLLIRELEDTITVEEAKNFSSKWRNNFASD